MRFVFKIIFIFITVLPSSSQAAVNVGIGKREITPPIGTPSAGYTSRKGAGMEGVHDPLLATALFIDNGEKKVVLCSVDHLGFTYEMVQEVIRQVHLLPELEECEIYIGSSHTHSGGGAYLDIPLIGESLAGPYNSEITKFYIQQTSDAIIAASKSTLPSKIGIGDGKAEEISTYRSSWPPGITPLSDVAIIKVTKLDGSPLAVLFNYPIHPTVLQSENRLFSSDFVGFAREHVQSLLGGDIEPIYFNGAQGDIGPVIFNEKDRFAACKILGDSLAKRVATLYDQIDTTDHLDIQTTSAPYTLIPSPTPFGLLLPLERYNSELNIVVLNKIHAFITIPGELSSIYDQRLKELGKKLGYAQVSIFGLTNDAHGYIILPESWRHATFESRLSFGGENYGEVIFEQAAILLQKYRPKVE